MQILTADQIRAWDEYTIQHEPISSLHLMERASATCFHWITQHYEGRRFSIFCAKGNNGGDGLALARMLSANHFVTVYILEFGYLGTEDFQTNLARLHQTEAVIKFIPTEENIPQIPPGDIIIDALFGSGLNRPIEGLAAALVNAMNECGNEIISIDIPSGLSADNSSKGHLAVTATHTLSFQCYKPAFLVGENESKIGELHILEIGLHPDYPGLINPAYQLINVELAKSILKKRNAFSHKGTFGHALLIAGSYGKMGAAILAAKGCLRSGVGLLTIHSPACGNSILQTAVPEAMVDTDASEKINTTVTSSLEKYNSIGVGPGIGTAYDTATLFQNIIEYPRAVVIDADALNILSTHPELRKKLPPHSILTPHPREFERLFGSFKNDFEAIQIAKEKSIELQQIIVLKGHHTFIATPAGRHFFNSTGNAGMATGGTGDVLTGILTALLAQGYSSEHAAILGVFIHGLAGDFAAEQFSEPSLIASDVVAFLGDAFKYLLGKKESLP